MLPKAISEDRGYVTTLRVVRTRDTWVYYVSVTIVIAISKRVQPQSVQPRQVRPLRQRRGARRRPGMGRRKKKAKTKKPVVINENGKTVGLRSVDYEDEEVEVDSDDDDEEWDEEY